MYGVRPKVGLQRWPRLVTFSQVVKSAAWKTDMDRQRHCTTFKEPRIAPKLGAIKVSVGLASRCHEAVAPDALPTDGLKD